MKILAVEFCCEERTAAILVDGRVAGEARDAGGRASRSVYLVETALQAAGLEREAIECLAVGLGPGSYTGIRAAISLAQGWQLARPVQVLGIPSLDALALQACGLDWQGTVHFVVDAQRNEFYLADYELRGSSWTCAGALRIVSRSEIDRLRTAGECLAGPEVTRWFNGARQLIPQAADIGRLAHRRTDFVSAAQLEPIYLREPAFVKALPPRVY